MPKNTVAGKPGLDPTLPKVSVKLADGATYFLVFDFNAVVLFESETSINLLTERAGDVFSNPAHLRTLLWCLLRGQDAEITEEQTGKLMDMRHYGAIVKAIMLAWQESLPEAEPGNA